MSENGVDMTYSRVKENEVFLTMDLLIQSFDTFYNREMGVHLFKLVRRQAITVLCSTLVPMALILSKKLLLCSNLLALATGSYNKTRSAMVEKS